MSRNMPSPRRWTVPARLAALTPGRVVRPALTRLFERYPRLAALAPWLDGGSDLAGLLDRLPPVEHRPAADEDSLFEQASLARALLLLVKVDQDAEYLLCRQLAEHALGSVPDPGPISA